MRKLIITILFCQFVVFADCQLSKVDSIKLSQQLEPYRKHLDSVINDLDAESLLFLIQTQPKERDEVKTNKSDSSTNAIIRNFEGTKIKDPLPKAKYSLSEIVPNDTNNILFVETEYDLQNRPYLISLKRQYSNSSKKSIKIKILLEYIESLNQVYPSYPNWAFSRSNTMQKYRKQVELFFNSMSNDTLKSDLYVEYAETIEAIDVSGWRNYIYSLYIEAKTILLAPYWKALAKKGIHLTNDTSFYKEYFIKHNYIDRLLNIYQGLYFILSPENTLNTDNKLYAFENKKNGYLNSAYHLLLAAIPKDNTKVTELENFEKGLIISKSLLLISPKTIHPERFLIDMDYLLKDVINKLISSNKERLSKSAMIYMYFGLGNIFSQLKQTEYALKAYYKSIQLIISTKEPLRADIFELYFYQITSLLKTAKINNSDEMLRFQIPNLSYLYTLLSGENYLQNALHSPTSYALQYVNQNRFLFLNGKVDSARTNLLCMKKYLVNDTSERHINTYTLAFVYKELVDNNWLIIDNNTNNERIADSSILAAYANQNSYIPTFDNNPDIIEQYNMFESVDIKSKFGYQTKELTEEIKNKAIEISKLNSERIKLSLENKKLNQDIKDKNEIFIQAINKNMKLDSANSKLVNRNQQLVADTTTLAKTILLQKREVTKWTKVGITGIIASILLFVVALYIVKKKKKQINSLNTEIKHLTQQKKTLEDETSSLKSIQEADRLRHTAELQSANDKILRELTVKHEIVGLISELYLGYENKFVNINDEIPTKKECVEFGKSFHSLESYSKHYYKLLQNKDFNSVDDEIQLCKKYVDVVKIRKSNFDVSFADLRSIKRSDIVLPHHILNNFSKNSIEKGKIEGKPLKIVIDDKLIDGVYCLTISDDGKGLPDNFSLNNLPEKSTGFKNTLGQIEYYNANIKLPYTIYFNEQSIRDRTEYEETSGVEVTLKFKSKSDAI